MCTNAGEGEDGDDGGGHGKRNRYSRKEKQFTLLISPESDGGDEGIK